jgi:hypothetical protein
MILEAKSSSFITGFVKKNWLFVAVAVVSFAFGRYTLKQSVIETVQKQFESKQTENIVEIEKRLTEQFKSSLEDVKKSIERASSKELETEETITVNKDGSQTIVRKTKQKEDTKSIENNESKTQITQDNKDQTDSSRQSNKEVITREVIKEVTKITPGPSWRMYAAAILDDPFDQRKVKYGAGTMYDIGPFNVGVVGLYEKSQNMLSTGLTFGISF